MKSKTDYQAFEQSSDANRRMLRQEELILEVTEALSKALQNAGISQSELAARLGKTKGFISQILAGGRNLTLRTIADFADALGQHVRVRVCERDEWLKSSLGDQPSEVMMWSASPQRPFRIVRSVSDEAAGSPARVEAVA